MDHNAYKCLRALIGSQEAVANALGVSRQTLINRETGRSPITRESELAIRCLASESGKAGGRLPKGITVSAPAVQPAPPPAKPGKL